MADQTIQQRLAAILAADVVGYIRFKRVIVILEEVAPEAIC